MIVAGPTLNVWRAGTDNDGIKLMLYPHTNLQRWLNQKLDRVEQRLESMTLLPGDVPVIEVVYKASGREQWDDFTHTLRFALQNLSKVHLLQNYPTFTTKISHRELFRAFQKFSKVSTLVVHLLQNDLCVCSNKK